MLAKFMSCKVLLRDLILISFENVCGTWIEFNLHANVLGNSGFRNQMLNAIKMFSLSRQNGLFINSCFAHCQSERQDTWFGNNSPRLANKVNLSFYTSGSSFLHCS